MLKMGCFSGRIQNVPNSVGGTLGPDGKMRTGEVISNCFNPPQYRPETNLLGFRVLIWTPAGRVIREALDRAKTPSPQRKRLKFASLVCDAKSRARRPRLLDRLTPLPKETWALVMQLLEARAGRRGVDGCGNFAASSGGG